MCFDLSAAGLHAEVKIRKEEIFSRKEEKVQLAENAALALELGLPTPKSNGLHRALLLVELIII
jgi:hypothetical protein